MCFSVFIRKDEISAWSSFVLPSFKRLTAHAVKNNCETERHEQTPFFILTQYSNTSTTCTTKELQGHLKTNHVDPLSFSIV